MPNKQQIIQESARTSTKQLRRPKLNNIDKNLVHFLSKRRKKHLTAFMKAMTWIGDGWVWFGICVLFFAIDIYAGLALTIASLLQVIFQVIIKKIFVRERPYVKYDEISYVIAPPDRFSFPSGHTAAAFAIAFVLFYFYPILFIPMLLLAAAIAFSRIYLGLHYPSDVLAGVLLGFICAKLGIFLALLIEL